MYEKLLLQAELSLVSQLDGQKIHILEVSTGIKSEYCDKVETLVGRAGFRDL